MAGPSTTKLDGEIQMAMFPPAPNGQRALAVATDVPPWRTGRTPRR